ncbi:MAG TPA: YqaJ viral recombinase family protein [Galbitalea sp.]|jgi:predicted phage-related endonuclease
MITLEDRAIASSEDRAVWLKARRSGVTATEISKLEAGGAAFGRILNEKRSGVESFTGNRYTEYGKAREEFIAAWVQERFDIAPNKMLYGSERNNLLMATPDGIGSDFNGNLVLAEIKTSKNNLMKIPRDYYVQMLWQMYVMGAQRVLFAWEQHDDQWPDPQPLEDEPRFQWVERDDTEIARLIEIADRFLEALAAEPVTEVNYDLELDELAQEVLVHREAEKVEATAKGVAWSALQAKLATKADYTQSSPYAKVTRSVTTTTVDEVDVDAAKAAAPDLFEKYEAINKEWADLLALHKKKVLKSSTSLTVTAVKGTKNA